MAYNTAEPRAEYSANAGQTEFDFVFKVFSISDLKVYSTPFGQTANDETDILIENIDYTVSINGDNGGTVTLTNPAGIDDVIVLLRDLPVKRDYEYQQGGDLSSDILNDDQDYQTYLLADKQRDSDRFLKLPDTAIIASNILPPILPNAYLKWNEDGTELQYDTSIPDAAILSTDAALIAESYATEPENVFVKTYSNGVPTPTTDYSALHWAAKSEGFAGDSDDSAVESQLSRWLSDAAKLTAQSYATEPENVFVKTYSSDGDGTFTATNTTDYSSLHWAAKSEESAQGLAVNISFDNSGTGIIATDVQDALVELDSEASNHINLSGVTTYHLLQGNLSISDEVITKGFGIFTYTGNSVTPPSINLGMDITSQWGNDVSETFGYLIKIKSRNILGDWTYVDSVRGITKYIASNTTAVEGTDANMFTLNTVAGVTTLTLGSSLRTNVTGTTYVIEIYQTTHRISGTTNQAKSYICHYNPTMGFSIDKMEGSGIAGHETPHMLGRKLGFVTIKNLSAVTQWISKSQTLQDSYILSLNQTIAQTLSAIDDIILGKNSSTLSTSNQTNAATNQYIMYGWANSYLDESNKLIGNYELIPYQGTGVAGNKVNTKGKPAWVMIKRVDSTGNWAIHDNVRGINLWALVANLPNVDSSYTGVAVSSDGFILQDNNTDRNTSGGQYIALVAYDTNSNGGGSYYPLASDTANVQVNNALIPIAQGIDSNGAKNTILSKNETITGLTYTQGENYVYCDKNGTYGRMSVAPNYGKDNPANGGDFYNVLINKWFTSAGVEITNSRNYLNHIVHADNDGGVLYVEELPKVEYKDIVKANEFQGKNACTAWVNFDGTTTPPTIRDKHNVSSVIRTSVGIYDIYFKEEMDNTKFTALASSGDGNNSNAMTSNYLTNKVTYSNQVGTSAAYNNTLMGNIQIFGGKN